MPAVPRSAAPIVPAGDSATRTRPSAVHRFGKQDIGAELLPVLTSGLYRDTLDTLREYIQNAIDASARHITLEISSTTIAVEDDGLGMDWNEARQAIRLGMSEKNPLVNVGFRGLGVYSAFNLCDQLDIYTRSQRDSQGYVLRFGFRGMREALLAEAERRKANLPPQLYLEALLEEHVTVSPDTAETIESHGTLALFQGVLEDAYDRLNQWDVVTEYLRNVVPLPFRDDFKFSGEIEERLTAEQSRIVPLTLKIGARSETLFRPYHDGMFSQHGKYPPKFFDVAAGGEHFGFAWVCINDARKVLPDKSLRGILIKKFEFSIADRRFLEPYFFRTVFNRRVTGELVVQHPQLIPNAARSDFEASSTRHKFFQSALPAMVRELEKWANEIQEREKAAEVVEEALLDLRQMEIDFPSVQRDKEQLLRWNFTLTRLKSQLELYQRAVPEDSRPVLQEVQMLHKDLDRSIREALVEKRQSQRRLEERAARAAQQELKGAQGEEPPRSKALPKTLVELLAAYDLLPSEDLTRAMRVLDDEILQVHLDRATYQEALVQLRDALEE